MLCKPSVCVLFIIECLKLGFLEAGYETGIWCGRFLEGVLSWKIGKGVKEARLRKGENHMISGAVEVWPSSLQVPGAGSTGRAGLARVVCLDTFRVALT